MLIAWCVYFQGLPGRLNPEVKSMPVNWRNASDSRLRCDCRCRSLDVKCLKEPALGGDALQLLTMPMRRTIWAWRIRKLITSELVLTIPGFEDISWRHSYICTEVTMFPDIAEDFKIKKLLRSQDCEIPRIDGRISQWCWRRCDYPEELKASIKDKELPHMHATAFNRCWQCWNGNMLQEDDIIVKIINTG